jgi:YHS domain-containing protein
LNVAGTAITDSGLANIAGLSDLTALHLEKTAITDAGLAHLKGLAKLEYLNLYSTGVTDAGLANLNGLKGLKKLYLWQTKVTDGGVAAMKKDVPAVIVNRGEELAIVVKTPEPTPAAAPAAGTTPVALGKPINTICPVSGKAVDETKVLAYEGNTVGFCCEKCPVAFAKTPAKFASKIKADAVPATPAAPVKPGEKAAEKPAAKPKA